MRNRNNGNDRYYSMELCHSDILIHHQLDTLLGCIGMNRGHTVSLTSNGEGAENSGGN